MTDINPLNRISASGKTRTPWGARIEMLLDGRSQKWLSEQSGVGPTTLHGMITSVEPKAESAVKIAQALGVTVEYLMTGAEGAVSGVREPTSDFSRSGDPNDAIRLPIVAEIGGGPSEGQPIVGYMSVPRAQLARLPYVRSELWLVPMPDATMGDLCAQGDLLICQGPDGGMSERAVYIYRLNNIPTIRRVKRVETGGIQLIADHPATEPIWAFMDGPDGTGPTLTVMARVAGAIRITPVT